MTQGHIVFVLGDRDYMKKWIYEIKDVMKYTDLEAKFSAFNIQNTQKGAGLKPTKVVFFLENATDTLADLVRIWIKTFEQNLRKCLRYCMLVQDDPGNNEDVEGIDEKNIIRFRNIAELYSWWPKLSNYLFGRSEFVEKTCFVWNMSPKYKKATELSKFITDGMLHIGINISEKMSSAKCIVCVTNRGTLNTSSLEGVALRTAKMEGRPVHAFLFRINEATDEIIWATSYQHSVHEKIPLRPFLCILSDLNKLNIKIFGHSHQVILAPPAAPFYFHSEGNGDYVKLVWHESRSVLPRSWFVVEIRVVTRCLTRTSEWTEIQKVPATGPGSRHEVIFTELHRRRPFQFRIYAESRTAKSKTRETNVFYPPGNTTVNDYCGCMASCMNKKRTCDCFVCVLTCGFTLWRHQLL